MEPPLALRRVTGVDLVVGFETTAEDTSDALIAGIAEGRRAALAATEIVASDAVIWEGQTVGRSERFPGIVDFQNRTVLVENGE